MFSTKEMKSSDKFYIYVSITAPFNNMRNLKFKSPPTVAFFAAVNQRTGSLRKRLKRVQRGKKVTFYAVIGGFHFVVFVGFHFSKSVDCRSTNILK